MLQLHTISLLFIKQSYHNPYSQHPKYQNNLVYGKKKSPSPWSVVPQALVHTTLVPGTTRVKNNNRSQQPSIFYHHNQNNTNYTYPFLGFRKKLVGRISFLLQFGCVVRFSASSYHTKIIVSVVFFNFKNNSAIILCLCNIFSENNTDPSSRHQNDKIPFSKFDFKIIVSHITSCYGAYKMCRACSIKYVLAYVTAQHLNKCNAKQNLQSPADNEARRRLRWMAKFVNIGNKDPWCCLWESNCIN